MKSKIRKRIQAIGIITLLIIVSFAGLTSGERSNLKSDTEHIVLIEQCTATNCYYCQFVDAELPDLVGNYERVSLGHSTYSVGAGYNSDINDRVDELGMESGFPKTYFDGDYEMVSGGWDGMITDLQAAYDSCAARTVADVDLDLTVTWLGGAELSISIEVTNNEASTYNGNIKVYVCEIDSRWDSYTGDPMVNGLLGFSIDTDQSITSGSTWSDTHTWDGDDHGYGDITSDNIRCIAVAFDQSTMYVDESIGVLPITNLAPTADFSYTPLKPSVDDVISFTDGSIDTDGTIVSWDWDFGNGDTDTAQNPTYQYTTAGHYTVTLIVEDDDGATDEISVPIVISNSGEIADAYSGVMDRGLPIRHATDGDWAGGQNFTPTVTTLTRAEIYVRTLGWPDFDLEIELREDDPTGTLIDNVTIPKEDISSSWMWLEFDFDDVTVTPDTLYCLTVPSAPIGIANSFGYEWGYGFGDLYPDGSFWFNRLYPDDFWWQALPNKYELAFCVYGTN